MQDDEGVFYSFFRFVVVGNFRSTNRVKPPRERENAVRSAHGTARKNCERLPVRVTVARVSDRRRCSGSRRWRIGGGHQLGRSCSSRRSSRNFVVVVVVVVALRAGARRHAFRARCQSAMIGYRTVRAPYHGATRREVCFVPPRVSQCCRFGARKENVCETSKKLIIKLLLKFSSSNEIQRRRDKCKILVLVQVLVYSTLLAHQPFCVQNIQTL